MGTWGTQQAGSLSTLKAIRIDHGSRLEEMSNSRLYGPNERFGPVNNNMHFGLGDII